jgi:hypothetical protein
LALRCGIPNELIWELSIPEIETVVQLKVEDDRAASLRAGLIAATILNVHRKKGTRVIQPQDFVRMPDDFMSPEAAQAYLDAWAISQGDGKIVAPTDAELEKYSGGTP